MLQCFLSCFFVRFVWSFPVVNGNDNVNDNYYTLDGRKLSGQPTQKGVYIHNGRSVVVK